MKTLIVVCLTVLCFELSFGQVKSKPDTTIIKTRHKIIYVIHNDTSKKNILIVHRYKNDVNSKNKKEIISADTIISNEDTIGDPSAVIHQYGKKIEIIKDTLIIPDPDNYSSGNHYNARAWWGIDIGVNGYLNPSGGLDVPEKYQYLDLSYSRSRNFRLNFLEQDFSLIRNYLQFVTGLGLEWDNYMFSGSTRLINDSNKIYGYTDSIKYQNSKLRVTYLNLPLMLQFNTGKDPSKNFHIDGGVILGYNIGTMAKRVFNDNGKANKNKERGDFGINAFTCNLIAKIGYAGIRLYGTYDLSSLFLKDKGPELYPFTLGLSFVIEGE